MEPLTRGSGERSRPVHIPAKPLRLEKQMYQHLSRLREVPTKARRAKVVRRTERVKSDASSSPPPPQSKHRPKYVVNWRSELCRLLQLSETATDENILDVIEEAEEKLRDAERRQYQSVADPGAPRSQVVYAIKCGSSVSPPQDDTLYLDPPWVVQSGPSKAHLRGSGNIRNMELYLERNKSVSALVYREYQCCGYDFQGQRPSQFDHLSEADLSQFFLRECIGLVSAESRAALTALSHAALTNLPHPDFDDGKPDIR
ncbi:hypothetical protein C8034_v000342 [Colletotrichum sidae]|uniref:Uncharacterized protein n=1 Tax=Colletotrichum sidae TaxID=1347389 RepID=A0A4R8TFQ6_9PEZI|nr:hypothetical protein C8034_v000342 [Colletotrichum sidae]